MKLKIFLVIIVGVMFLICLPSSYAEVYKYIYENGVVFYTDDYSKILASDRESMEVIEEIENPEKEGVTVEDENTSQKEDLQEGDSVQGLDAIREELAPIKKELDKEYATLSVEKERLVQEEKKAASKEEKIRYNENVTDFNNSIKLYTAKSKAYQTRAEEFNNRVRVFIRLGERHESH